MDYFLLPRPLVRNRMELIEYNSHEPNLVVKCIYCEVKLHECSLECVKNVLDRKFKPDGTVLLPDEDVLSDEDVSHREVVEHKVKQSVPSVSDATVASDHAVGQPKAHAPGRRGNKYAQRKRKKEQKKSTIPNLGRRLYYNPGENGPLCEACMKSWFQVRKDGFHSLTPIHGRYRQEYRSLLLREVGFRKCSNYFSCRKSALCPYRHAPSAEACFLPEEMWLQILSYLPISSILSSVIWVSTDWKRMGYAVIHSAARDPQVFADYRGQTLDQPGCSNFPPPRNFDFPPRSMVPSKILGPQVKTSRKRSQAGVAYSKALYAYFQARQARDERDIAGVESETDNIVTAFEKLLLRWNEFEVSLADRHTLPF